MDAMNSMGTASAICLHPQARTTLNVLHGVPQAPPGSRYRSSSSGVPPSYAILTWCTALNDML